MSRFFLVAFFLLAFLSTAHADDKKIKQEIIQQSIANYSGNCPCPYNRDRAGRSCGRRSAYSKPGGYSPVCYPGDVTPEMIDEYLARKTR